MTRFPSIDRVAVSPAEARATGATKKAATRPYSRILNCEVQGVSGVARSDGPVRGEAAMQYSTPAIDQQVPHDRATVRQNRSAAASERALTDTTASAMPTANQQK